MSFHFSDLHDLHRVTMERHNPDPQLHLARHEQLDDLFSAPRARLQVVGL